MNTYRQIFWNNPPACAAYLGGVGRVHGDHLNTGAFSLVFQHLPEQSKACVMRGQGKVSVSVHETEAEVLNPNQVVLGHKPGADLMQKIRPLMGDPFMQAGNPPIGFSLATATFGLAGSVSLPAPQFGKVLPQPAGVLNQFARREGRQALQTHIDAHLFSSQDRPLLRGGQFHHQADIPVIAGLLDDNVLEFCFDWNIPVVAHADFAHILDVERSAALLVLTQLAAIAVGIFEALEAIPVFETGKTWLFACLQAAKEGRKGLVQSAQQVLQAGSVDLSKRSWVLPAQISKAGPLGSIPYAFACLLVGGNPLLESSVVDQAGLPEQEVQLFGLFRIRAKEIFISAEHRQGKTPGEKIRTSVLITMSFVNHFRKEVAASPVA